MNWTRVTEWAEISDCERYTVSMARSQGRYTFEAWLRSTVRSHAAEPLGARSTPDEAKVLCEEHAAKVPA